MDKQIISIQPQIIQFTSDSKQLIKVTNRSNQTIQNCFFCLFNTKKYQFSPDTFTLQPKQHKLISVIYKLKATQSSTKQFAYLKSKNLNKRLTLLHISQSESHNTVQKQLQQQSGMEEINTFSSRDYKQIQKSAYEKIISQKQSYISKLQRKLQQNSFHFQKQKQQSTHKNNKIYLNEIHQLELQLALFNKQKEQLIKDNIELNAKFKEYRILMQTDSRIAQLNLKIQEITKQNISQAQEIKFLEIQCEQFLRKIQQKEEINKDLQFHYVSKIDSIIKQGERKLQQMQTKVQQQRKSLQKAYKQQLAQQTSKLTKQIKLIESELSNKQKQLKSLQTKLQQQKKLRQQHQQMKKKLIKIQLQKQNLAKVNKQYKQKINGLQLSYSNLKQQSIIYKNKLDDQDTSNQKLRQYLESALEGQKNQNNMLKIQKAQMQKKLQEQLKNKLNIDNRNKIIEQQMSILQSRNKQLQKQNIKLNEQLKTQEQENHDKIILLKSENVDLIQKLNKEQRKLEEKLQQSQRNKEMIRNMADDLNRAIQERQIILKKYEQIQQEKEKMDKKVQKYRKQVRKSRNSISDHAKQQLRRIEQQKNNLARKIQELEVSVQHTSGNQLEARHKTRTQHQEARPQTQLLSHQNIHPKYPMSVEGDRRVGIRNQRRQLQESHLNSRSEVDMDKIYGQLGQLRQLKNYMNNEIKKFNQSYGIGDDSRIPNENNNSIFSAINFFKDLQQKLANKFGNAQKLAQAQKQIQFLRGRLTELEPIVKTLKNKQQKPQQLGNTNKIDIDRNAIQYIRQEMKNQYKKLYDALKLSQEKFEILRKKIYEQYRARIIESISKKDRDQYTVNKLEAVLQRFVEGLGNTSHKEAVLAKQVKLKMEAKKQASLLKDKLNTLTKQIQNNNNKKGAGGTCIREPFKFQIENDKEWIDAIKLEAKMLTYEAQNARLMTQKSLHTDKLSQICDQLKLCESDLQTKQQEIQKLKKQVIQITKQNQCQLQKHQQELAVFRKKFNLLQKLEKQVSDLQIKQKENVHLRDQLQEKRQIIKNLKDKQKLMEQLLDQSRRNQSNLKDREKKQYMQESRMQQSLKDLKQNNRELRAQNAKLREQVDSLVEDINKKNAALKRFKTQTQQYRIKIKPQSDSIQKLKSQITSLKQQLRKSKQQLQKQKAKKSRQLSQKLAEFDKIKTQCGIQKNILESIIRSLADTIKGIYCSLDILARKRGKILGQQPNFDEMLDKASQIRSVKIRQAFDEVIQALKQ